MLRVLALTYYDRLGASSRLRFFQYLSYLRAQGIAVDISYFLSSDYVERRQRGLGVLAEAWAAFHRRLSAFPQKVGYDLMWIEKECFPWLPALLETSFLGSHPPFVLDYDDAVFHQYDQHRNSIVRKLLADKHPILMKRSSLVIAGNPYLEEFARSSGAKHVATLPTAIDLGRYMQVGQFSAVHNPVRVGWIGQRSTAKFLKPLANLFLKLSRDGSVIFRAIGIDPRVHEVPMEGVDWSEETEVGAINDLDIGIMPLTDGPFERGKCGYKLIQYMGCGLPVVASPVGINKEIVEHGVTGFLAETEAEWFNALRTLIKDAAMRERMGRAGRLKVERQFSTNVTAPRLAELLKEAATGLKP
jgi:glycosyltransferase involved in cell wall biosynthesis